MTTEMSDHEFAAKQDVAYVYGENLAKKHGTKDMGYPKLDKILELVGLKGAEEKVAEEIFARFEEGYYNQKFENMKGID